MNWFLFLMALKCWVLLGPSLAPGGIPTRGAAPLINTSTHVLQIQCATSNFQIVHGPRSAWASRPAGQLDTFKHKLNNTMGRLVGPVTIR